MASYVVNAYLPLPVTSESCPPVAVVQVDDKGNRGQVAGPLEKILEAKVGHPSLREDPQQWMTTGIAVCNHTLI
jgi:hypothetical protein